MKTKKIILGLCLTFLLSACGGGSSSFSVIGQETDEQSFQNEAASRVNVAQSGYTKAHVKFKHSQNFASAGKGSQTFTIDYSWSGSSWTLVNLSDYSISNTQYVNMINFTMNLYDNFLSALSTMASSTNKTFYMDDTGSSVLMDIDLSYSAQNIYGKSKLSIAWNEYGMLTRFIEDDVYTQYSSYGNGSLVDDMTFTYSR